MMFHRSALRPPLAFTAARRYAGQTVTQDIAYQPDVAELARCIALAADSMRLARPDPGEAEAFVSALIYRGRPSGRDVIAALTLGLLTRAEARNLVMAHAATWLADLNGVPEPSYELWCSSGLEASFSRALLGAYEP
jgi:hypothetical protein